jgi:hypothetical protein
VTVGSKGSIFIFSKISILALGPTKLAIH